MTMEKHKIEVVYNFGDTDYMSLRKQVRSAKSTTGPVHMDAMIAYVLGRLEEKLAFHMAAHFPGRQWWAEQPAEIVQLPKVSPATTYKLLVNVTVV